MTGDDHFSTEWTGIISPGSNAIVAKYVSAGFTKIGISCFFKTNWAGIHVLESLLMKLSKSVRYLLGKQTLLKIHRRACTLYISPQVTHISLADPEWYSRGQNSTSLE
jgi:hypothetical protein